MESANLTEGKKEGVKKEVKTEEVKMEVNAENAVKDEVKKDSDECKEEEWERKDSLVKESESEMKVSGSTSQQNGDQTASTSQEVPLQSDSKSYRTDEYDRTMMNKEEIERKFTMDLEGLIDRSLSATDDKKPEMRTKYGWEENVEKKDENERKEEENMDVAESKATHNGPIVQNGPTDLSKHEAKRSPTPSKAGEEKGTDKDGDDKQGCELDKPLSLEPKREVSSPSKASTPTPSKVSTPRDMSTPSSSTRGDVSSPSLSDSKSSFMNLDSILHRGTPQPYVLANPYAAATSAATPVISEHLLKGIDAKPNGSMGTWFSILPRMPCDDESLTSKTQTTSESSSSDQQIPAELKHSAAAMPFNVTPYGLYQMPFPLMHMNQMNPLVGAYAAFPGFSAVPLQAIPGVNGPLDLSNPMIPVGVPQQQQEDVKPDIKMEIKKEEPEEDESDKESAAITNMRAMLDQIEQAVEQPIPEGKRQW